jgi:hypothetical protein
MYGATENRTTQINMLTAAAKQTVPQDEADVLEAVLTAHVRPAAKFRDKLAHWCWGLSPNFPDALLLTPPPIKMALHHYALDAPAKPKIDRKNVYLITESDLRRAVKRVKAAQAHLGQIVSMVRAKTKRKRGAIRRQLSNEPLIAEALVRIRTARRKGQEDS